MVTFVKKIPVNLETLNKLLFIGVILSIVYTAFYYFNQSYFFEKKLPKSITSVKSFSLGITRDKKDYANFLSKIANRDLFTGAYGLEKSGASVDSAKIINNLRLVGIISGQPLKIMIEDSASKKTFYLEEGESFLGKIVVEKIYKGSVLLNCYGEEFELYL